MAGGRTLHRALAGARVTADFRVPQLATTELAGTVVESASRGKHLLTRFDTGDTLHTHLKMEGSWHLYRPGEHWRRPAHEARRGAHRRGVDRRRVRARRRRAGRTDAEDTVVGHLGPDLLGPDWDPGRGGPPAAADPGRPSPTRCSTSATWPASATCTRTSSASSPACTPAPRSRRRPTCPRLVDRAHRMLLAQPRPRRAGHHRRPAPRPAALGLPARPPALPPLRHPDPGRPAGPRGTRSVRAYWCPRASRRSGHPQ